MIPKELIIYKDKLYYVHRYVRKDNIKDGYVNDVKEFWNCDLVLRGKDNSETYIFLKHIEDAEIVN